MALSPAEMDEAVLRTLAGKTGKDLDDWKRLLGNAGPFAKPAAAVNWLKGEHGLGHVTAQIIVRKWTEQGTTPPDGDPVEAVLGRAGADALRRILADLAAQVPDVEVMPRKAYVGLGTPVQFAVAVRPRSGDALLWLALVAQDDRFPSLPTAPRVGGSDRFTVLLEIAESDDTDIVLAHLRAAARRR